jgi:GT2 family glycosyltransferase
MTIGIEYFNNLILDIKSLDNFVAITGNDEDFIFEKSSFLHRFFSLGSKIQGSLLSSGRVTQPTSLLGLSDTQWLPGLSMNLNPRVLEQEKFDESIRMYGEDLEISLRLKKYGIFKCSANLLYRHNNAIEGRENSIQVTSLTDGIRWRLARTYPSSIKRPAVLWSITGEIFFNLIKVMIFDKAKLRIQIIFGHLIFIFRIIFGLKYTQ